MTANLDSIAVAADQPSELILKSPITGEPLYDASGKPASIMLLGRDSAVAKRHERSTTQKLLDKRGRGKTKVEELEASSIELLVALTVSWHLVNFEGEVIDYACTPANARALYSNAVFGWVREQADEFAGDRAGFLKSSASYSSSGLTTTSA
jgi:hypothetical protein